ncbi:MULTISPECIES: hypothetical protein [Sphingobacterium]|uniref:Uncharacterized protein n=1 Tax=Sphingobacterium populi TaxID=1812824 RepID=A0ABW5UII0_9SPHI|nr:hypothetical protein [Sphingobacterium sp. CFCC 11742]
MKLFVLILSIALIGCLNENRDSKVESPNQPVIKELPELEYLCDTSYIGKVVSELKEEYGFGDLGFEDISILKIQNRNDSIFFDFSIIDPKFFELHSKEFSPIKSCGFLKIEHIDIIVFDQMGVFKETSRYKKIDFGVQEIDYSVPYEPLLLRFCLENDGQLNFLEEQWLDYGKYLNKPF